MATLTARAFMAADLFFSSEARNRILNHIIRLPLSYSTLAGLSAIMEMPPARRISAQSDKVCAAGMEAKGEMVSIRQGDPR